MLCDTCLKRSKCVKTCLKIEKYLRSKGIYSKSWMRPQMPSNKRKVSKWREIPFSAMGDQFLRRNGIGNLTSGTN